MQKTNKTRLKPDKIENDLKLKIFFQILYNDIFSFDFNDLLKSHKDYGKIIKDNNGKLRCHICGKYYRGLFSHIWQSHGVSLKEYKILFGITQRTPLVSDDIREIKKGYITGEVKNKLLSDGYNTRYK